MVYQITIRKKAIKILEDISEPYFLKSKLQFIVLPIIQDLRDVKNLKAETDTEFVLRITGLFMKYLMIN